MRDQHYGYGCSGYQIATILNELGEKGKLGGRWQSSTVLRTINYEFHKNRDKPQFVKPKWWSNATFTDLIPWDTDNCLNFYSKNTIAAALVKPQPTSAQSAFVSSTKATKPVESFSQESIPRSKMNSEVTYADCLMNWDEL